MSSLARPLVAAGRLARLASCFRGKNIRRVNINDGDNAHHRPVVDTDEFVARFGRPLRDVYLHVGQSLI